MITDDKNKPLKDWEGDPTYARKDDIFENERIVPLDPDNIGTDENGDLELDEEADLNLDEGLDVPGADLDDADEFVGEEDEENNYYSLGGEDNENLEASEDD